MVGDYEPREQVAWNIASDQAKHVSTLIKRGIDFYLKGNFGECYWTFTGIRFLINCELNTDERKEFDDIEIEANKLHSSWDKYRKLKKDGLTPSEELEKDKKAFAGVVKIYIYKIMDFLKELGYLPSKEDRTHLGF